VFCPSGLLSVIVKGVVGVFKGWRDGTVSVCGLAGGVRAAVDAEDAIDAFDAEARLKRDPKELESRDVAVDAPEPPAPALRGRSGSGGLAVAADVVGCGRGGSRRERWCTLRLYVGYEASPGGLGREGERGRVGGGNDTVWARGSGDRK
jgi:hypothetical protein